MPKPYPPTPTTPPPSTPTTPTADAPLPAWTLPQAPTTSVAPYRRDKTLSPSDPAWRNQLSGAPIGAAMDAPRIHGATVELKGPKPGKFSANFEGDNRGKLAASLPQLDSWISWHVLPTGEVLLKTATSRPGDIELRQIEAKKLSNIDALAEEFVLRLAALQAKADQQ